MLFCKQYGLIENGFCDGRIELAMKFNEDGVLFIKPFYKTSGIFPLTKRLFIFSKIDLLILPSSLLEGFIKGQGKLDCKLSLYMISQGDKSKCSSKNEK